MENNEKRIVRTNTVLSIIVGTLRSVVLLVAYGTVFQTFMVSLGFSSSQIYINTTIVQAMTIVVTPLCSKWADKGNIFKRAALCHLPTAILLLVYLPVCFRADHSDGTFWYLTACSACHVVVVAFYGVIDYKLPYFIFPAKDYAAMMSVTGVVSGLISLGIGVLLTAATAWMPFTDLMLIACISCCVMALVSGVLVFRLKPLLHIEQSNTAKIGASKKHSLTELFKTPIFARLIPGNFLRGVSTGGASVMAAIALDLGYGEDVTTALISVSSGVTLVAYTFFGVLSRKFNPRIILGGGVLSVLFLPLLLLRGSPVFFLGVYAVVLLGRLLVDVSVPYILRYAVPVEIAGPYNAWRLVIYFVGFVLSTSLAAMLPLAVMLIISVIAQLITGINYCFDKELIRRLPKGGTL